MGVDFRYRLEDSRSERSMRRRMRLLGRIKNVCPHIYSIDTADEAGNFAIAVQFAVETVFGEMGYHCMMCRSKWSPHGTDLLRDSLERAMEEDPKGTIRDVLQAEGPDPEADP